MRQVRALNLPPWIWYATMLGLFLAPAIYRTIEAFGGSGRWSVLILTAGQLAGLLAGAGILLQLTLISRCKPIERATGLDRLTRVHHAVGLTTAVLIVCHPLLVGIAHARFDRAPFLSEFADFFRDWDYVWLAGVAWVLLISSGVVSLGIIRRRLKYERWYAVHLAAYLALAIVLPHQLAVGEDLAPGSRLRTYWLGLYIAAVGVWATWRVLAPVAATLRHRFVVQSVKPETDNVVSIHIAGRNMRSFRMEAGQFVIVRFLSGRLGWQGHPFSLSKIGEGGFRLSIKNVGDFTSQVGGVRTGAHVIVDGPHGVFTLRRCVSSSLLLIAAGIGITPLRSIAEAACRRGMDVVLLYGNRQKADIVFLDELQQLAAAWPGLRIVHVLSRQSDWPGESGRIDQEKIARLVPDARQRDVFICGPPAMLDETIFALRRLGTPRRQIHFERFSL